MTKKTYSEKFKDPRWQRKRLEALQRAEFACQICGDIENTLHVHHKAYFKGREPWEYDVGQLAVLCESCHAEHHASEDELTLICSFLPMDGPFSRASMAGVIAGFIDFWIKHEGEKNYDFYLGKVAGTIFDFAKIGDLLLLAEHSETDARGMYEALVKYVAAKRSGA